MILNRFPPVSLAETMQYLLFFSETTPSAFCSFRFAPEYSFEIEQTTENNLFGFHHFDVQPVNSSGFNRISNTDSSCAIDTNHLTTFYSPANFSTEIKGCDPSPPCTNAFGKTPSLTAYINFTIKEGSFPVDFEHINFSISTLKSYFKPDDRAFGSNITVEPTFPEQITAVQQMITGYKGKQSTVTTCLTTLVSCIQNIIQTKALSFNTFTLSFTKQYTQEALA